MGNEDKRFEIPDPAVARSEGMFGLLLEQVFKRLARVVRTRRRRSRGGRLLRVRCGRRILLDGHAEFVELAVVLRVLGRDAFRDGLRAFELRAGIKKPALFAAMQFELAFGALSGGVEPGGKHRATVRATAACHRSDHARRARAELILPRTA